MSPLLLRSVCPIVMMDCRSALTALPAGPSDPTPREIVTTVLELGDRPTDATDN